MTSEKSYSTAQRLDSHISNHPLTLTSTGNPQNITTTSDTAINGLSATVTAGMYRVHGVIFWQQGSTASVQNFSIHGPTVSRMQVWYEHFLNGGGASNGVGRWTNVSVQAGSPNFAANSVVFFTFDGVIEFSAGGTFSVQVSEGTAGNALSILIDSFCDLWPVI